MSGVIVPISVGLAGLPPILIYGMRVGVASSWMIDTLMAAQVVAIMWLLTSRLPVWWRAMLVVGGLVVVAGVVFLLELPAPSVGLAMGGLCHATAYAGLLIWFGLSLRRGQEPLVTGFARQMRPTMPVRVVRYTRWVTVAWCAFFAAQLGVSAGLLILAPASAWVSFVNLLNLPLIVAMILAEFACRLVLFRREPRTGLIATLTGLRRIRATLGSGS